MSGHSWSVSTILLGIHSGLNCVKVPLDRARQCGLFPSTAFPLGLGWWAFAPRDACNTTAAV